jgi:hypothetical protein
MADSAGTIVVRVVTDDRASAGLKKIQGNLSRLGKGAEGGGLKQLVGGLGQLEQGFSRGQASGLGMLEAVGGVGAGAMAAAAGVVAVVGGLVAFTAAGNKANSQADQFKMQIRALTASADEADAAFTALDDFADSTLFDDAQVFSAGRALLAAGMAAKDLVPTLEILQAASGQNGATFAALSDSFATLSSRSVATSKNLISLQQAGKIDVFGILAEQMGRSREEIKGLAAGGKLLTKEVLPMILKGIGETTKGLNDEMRQSLPFLESEFGNAAEDASKAWSKGLEPISKSIYGGLGESFRALETIFKDVFSNPIVQDFIGALQEGLGALGDVASAVGGVLKDVFSVLGFILIPITYALKAFAAVWRLVADGLNYVNRFLKPVWDYLRGIGQQLKAGISWLSGFGVQLGQLGKWILLTIANFASWILNLPLVKAAIELVSGAATWLWNTLKDLAGTAWELTLKGFDEAKRIAGEVYDAVKPFVDNAIELAISVAQTSWDALKRLGESLGPIASRVIDVSVKIAQDVWDGLGRLANLFAPLTNKIIDIGVKIAEDAWNQLSKLGDMIPGGDKIIKLALQLLDQGWQDLKAVWKWLSDKFPDNSWDAIFRFLVPGYDTIVMVTNWLADNITPLFDFIVKVLTPYVDDAVRVATWIYDHLTDLFSFAIQMILPGFSVLAAVANWIATELAPYFTVDLQIRITDGMIAGLKSVIVAALGPLGLILMAGEVIRGTTTTTTTATTSGHATVDSPPSTVVNTYAPDKILGGLIPGISSGSGSEMGLGGGCFTADTRITTEHGLLRIADVVVGQMVDVWDSGTVVQAPVSRLHIHEDHAVWFLRIEGDICHTTAEHPWLTPSGWVRADELIAGSTVMTPSGLETVQDSHAAGLAATVYNITVDHPAHTYLVGTARWIVHNKMALAKGGIVSSPTVALIGEKGAEAVIPLDRAFGSGGGIGGVSIGSLTINVSGFADPAAAGASAADAFRRQLGLQRRLPFGTA